jgi:dTDP-4-dehydrorhamnose reductase
MLGHSLCSAFAGDFETWATVRGNADQCALDPGHILGEVDAMRFESVERAITLARPDAVINCIGVIKQRPEANDPLTSITINALFPHQLARVCQPVGARLLHISTDCVFSGRKGHYCEGDFSDAEDLYGRTKYLGEVSAAGCLTLRTSIIGRELGTSFGLLEWFLQQRGGTVRGFSRAIFSGFTTGALTEMIRTVLVCHPRLEGLLQVSSEPISKNELLRLLDQALELGETVEQDDSFD